MEDWIISRLAKGQAKQVKLYIPPQSAERLIEVAKALAPKDWRSAESYLERDEDGIPYSPEVWDKVLHIDFVLNWRGYLIGVDCTINSDAVKKKLHKLKRCIKAHRELELDAALVLCVAQGTPANLGWGKDLTGAVKRLVKSEEPVGFFNLTV